MVRFTEGNPLVTPEVNPTQLPHAPLAIPPTAQDQWR